MARDAYKVDMAMYRENRARLLAAFRNREGSTNGSAETEFILLQGGEQQTRYCTDHEPLFRQESYFSYLFGVTESWFLGSISLSTGKATLFIPRLPSAYAVWMGEINGPDFFKKKYEVDEAAYVDELPEVLTSAPSAGARSQHPPRLYLLQGINTDSGNSSKPARFEGIDAFQVDEKTLHPLLSECRVLKSPKELDLLRYVTAVSSAAHVEVMRKAKAGMVERQLEAIFLNRVYFSGGCRHVSYTCICASSHNSAVLHYGHAGAPNDRVMEDGDLALLDMGAEFACYGADITCSFPIGGKFTAEQRMVYEAVLAAQESVFDALAPGVSWVDMHRLAERRILEGLTAGGVLQGPVEEMMSQHLGAVFMPHGLGHFLGIDTHDVGGYNSGPSRSDKPGLRSLRTARTLQEGMVITVEPGCYFIDALLLPAMDAEATCRFFIRDRIERLRGSGGVRLEDDVLITSTGMENLTNCPRSVADVEAVMAGKPWPTLFSID